MRVRVPVAALLEASGASYLHSGAEGDQSLKAIHDSQVKQQSIGQQVL